MINENPKQKAKELIMKFALKVSQRERQEAISLSLEFVNEMLNQLDKENDLHRCDYWNKVKKQIEKS